MRLTTLLFLVFLMAGTGSVIRLQAAPGDLDLTFSNDGRVTTPVGSASSVAIQADGKIVTSGGGNAAFTLVRYHPNGSLDYSFDADGIVFATFGDVPCYANAVAIQSDGKIVVAGYSGYGSAYKFALARFNADGSLDASFDGDGKITTQISGNDMARTVMLQSDGKIVAAGFSGDWSNLRGVVVRYNPDGTLDTSFDGDGKVTTPSGFGITGFFSAVLQADNRIVVAGASDYWYIGVIRYNTDGSLDSSFGGNGRVIFNVDLPVDFLGEHSANAVQIQSDGKIVVAGVGHDSDWYYTAIVGARLTTDGTFDSSFGTGGKFFTETLNYLGAAALAVQPNGKIVVAGTRGFGDFHVLRYNANGNLDSYYGFGGEVIVDFGGPSGASGMSLDSRGRAVVAGGGPGGFALARLLGDTAVASDAAPFDYDGDGKSDASVYRPTTNEWHIAQSGGGIRVQSWGVAGDRMAPADFDGDGKTDIAVFRETDSNWYILNSSNNTLTISGWGLAGDQPVPFDYGGDGKADIAVYRSSESKWYRRDSDGRLHFNEWGLPGDKPAPADFDGDGITDMTVFRPSNGTWYMINSGSGAISEGTWGIPGDLPVPADYSGDGKADFAVFRPSDKTWYRRHTNDNSIHIITWGIADDIPAPGDYDGDGKQDLAVFRPSNGTWHIFASQAGIYSQPFGLTGDKPTPNAYVY